jgi:uncharacterized protein
MLPVKGLAMFNFLSRRKRTANPAPVQAAVLASEGFHIPAGKLSRRTAQLHYALASLGEELEAIDWYNQRADDTEDEALKAILLHNAKEETEHAAMLLEWLRRNDAAFGKELKEYLFRDGPIAAREGKATGRKPE